VVRLLNKNPAQIEFGSGDAAVKCPPGTMVEMADEMFAMLQEHPAAKAHFESEMFEVTKVAEPKSKKSKAEGQGE
jgi:hypothetical protein